MNRDRGHPATDFRLLFETAPAAVVVVLPDDPVFTVVAASDAYLRVSGAARADLVGCGLFGSFPDNPDIPGVAGSLNIASAFRRAIATGEPNRIPAQRYDVERPPAGGGGFEERWWRILDTPVAGADGRVEYLIHMVEEVTENIRAEHRAQAAARDLERSDRRFRQLAEASTFGLAIGNLDGPVLYLNAALRHLLGYSEDEVSAGLVRRADLTPPLEFDAHDAEAVRQLAAFGHCAPYEKEYAAKDGRRIPVLIGSSILETPGNRTEVADIVLDLTARRASERRDAFLVRLDDATRPLANPNDIIMTSARLLGERLRVDRCAYCAFEADENTLGVDADYTRPGVPSVVGRYMLSDFGEDSVRLARANLPIVVDDIERDYADEDVKASYRHAGIAAHADIPLHKGGRLVALMFVHQQRPRHWIPEEIELLRLVANRCWESIERGRLMLALQASERLLRLAQKAGRIGTFEWFIEERRVFWTPELEALYGLPEGGFEGKFEGWSRRVVPEDVQRVTGELEEVMRRGEAEHVYQFRAVLPDGGTRWLRGQGHFSYNEAGRAVRMVGINIDIDAQQQAEAHLNQQWRTFDAILSNTPDLLYTFDPEGRFTYANRALLTVSGRPLEHTLGRTVAELGYPADLADRIRRQIRQVIDTGQPVRDSTEFSIASGEIRNFEYIYVPVRGVNGNVEAVAGATRDITERMQAEEQERLRATRLQESARLESLGVMAGGIAHDFNNLLTGILGNASLLAEDLTGSRRGSATQIVLAAERAADLTRQMLAFSGKGRFVMEAIDLNALVRENLTLVRASLSKTVSVDLELGAGSLTIEADRGQIQQVVMNLLINASEAVGERPGTVAIRTGFEDRGAGISGFLHTAIAPGRYVLLEVRDNGSGMSPETLKKIFDPFFTTKFTGRGLGLAAVLGIVKGHNGDIQVESRQGHGTTFRILLPATDRVARQEKNRARPPVENPVGHTILVVDDEAFVRDIAVAGLESRGFHALPATNGVEALEMLRANPSIALVILDLTMPVMTGAQALPLIKELRPELPVILSSGFSEAEVARRFSASGIAGVLQKPWSISGMAARIQQALERSPS